MKNRLLLLITLLSLVAFGFACGGAATNSNNANVNKSNTSTNTMSNSSTNTSTNAAANTTTTTTSNSTSTTTSNSTSANKTTPTNTKANTKTAPANTAANKTATAKPPKGSTFECTDGTFSDAKTSQGACSGHGGIKKALK